MKITCLFVYLLLCFYNIGSSDGQRSCFGFIGCECFHTYMLCENSHLNQVPFIERMSDVLEISLLNNSLTTLEIDQRYNKIETLQVSTNPLTTVSFKNIDQPALRSVKLDTNEITFINTSCSSLIQSLSYFSASGNRLTSISSRPHSGFARFVNLIKVYLSNNAISLATNFPVSLQLLDLSHNQIASHEHLEVANCQNLKYLDVSHNDISVIDFSRFPLNLQVMNLANNKIECMVNYEYAASFFLLEELLLSGNKIKMVEMSTFPSTLRYLDISNNMITHIEFANTVNYFESLMLNVSYNHRNCSRNHELEMKLQGNVTFSCYHIPSCFGCGNQVLRDDDVVRDILDAMVTSSTIVSSFLVTAAGIVHVFVHCITGRDRK